MDARTTLFHKRRRIKTEMIHLSCTIKCSTHEILAICIWPKLAFLDRFSSTVGRKGLGVAVTFDRVCPGEVIACISIPGEKEK
jgi:hypothetical protein